MVARTPPVVDMLNRAKRFIDLPHGSIVFFLMWTALADGLIDP